MVKQYDIILFKQFAIFLIRKSGNSLKWVGQLLKWLSTVTKRGTGGHHSLLWCFT